MQVKQISQSTATQIVGTLDGQQTFSKRKIFFNLFIHLKSSVITGRLDLPTNTDKTPTDTIL